MRVFSLRPIYPKCPKQLSLTMQFNSLCCNLSFPNWKNIQNKSES